MATNTTTALTNQYQRHFSKQMLDHAVQLLVLNQFGVQRDLPKNLGSKSVRFFRLNSADASQVQALTEGTPISTFRDLTYTPVDVDLVQYGEAMKFTDILSMTSLFDALKDGIKTMGEDCALHADGITRNEVVTNVTSAGQRRYAQQLANFTALAAASASAGRAVIDDYLDAMTQLKVNRAPTAKGGDYIAVIPPQVSRDLLDDDKFVQAGQYSGRKELFKGELGMFYGVRFVEGTNPYRESSTQNTYDAAGGIFTSICTGSDAYGVVKLAGGSPFSPGIIIVDQADKADPLNQYKTAGWKSYWAAKLLNENWAVTIRSKSTFA